MIQASLELYLDGQWKEFHLYNQLVFDERKDGQLASGMCYIRTKEKVRFKPMRKARLNLIEDDVVKKQYYYFAYFKSQKTDLEYWMHEVTLIDPAKRVQGEMINGLRVVQNESNSISLYDTFVRLCNTTPLRLTTQENVYNPAVDGLIIPLMKKIRSPEYAWSCRTLFWECLKEIGMDMGGYFPTVSFGENGKYVISFIPTENIVKTVTDFPYFSYAEGEDINQVCSEIDTDISNVIATNQGTASVVFPSQNGWITPRTDDIRLETGNCEIQLGSTPEKLLHVWVNISGLEIQLYDEQGYLTKPLSELLNSSALDIAYYIPEYKEWSALSGYSNRDYGGLGTAGKAQKCKNNTIYWIEGTEKIILDMSESHRDWLSGDESVLARMISYSLMKACNGHVKTIENNAGGATEAWFIKDYWGNSYEVHSFNLIYRDVKIDVRQRQFRVEYISRDTSTKIRAVKQQKCDYEYVQPFNQRAEIVDADSLGKEMDKTVNQMGVPYIKAAWRYKSLSDILPIGTAFVKDSETYILTVNECELTSHDNILVTHTFSKNWSMISSYLKQNKQYRNTKIPTDILVRNLHFQDYFVIAEELKDGAEGALTAYGIELASYVFRERKNENTEVNNFALYYYDNERTKNKKGAVISCNSFGMKKSIILSAALKNNISAGKHINTDEDYYCKEVLYTNDEGEFDFGGICRMQFGILNSDLSPNELPYSQSNLTKKTNIIGSPILDKRFLVQKSSAEHINMTYQVHFVSENPEIIVGGLLAEKNPLVTDLQTDLKYQMWGLTRPISQTTLLIDESYGKKISDITSSNRAQYWEVVCGTHMENGQYVNQYFCLKLLGGKMQGNYIGWAITDENGILYLARNGKANQEQSLYFNHVHKYHEED